MKLEDTFTFGKYEGWTLLYVIEENPFYVDWCVNNVSGFKISTKASDMVDDFITDVLGAIEEAKNSQLYKD